MAERVIVLPGQYGPPFDAAAVGRADTATLREWLSVAPVRSRTVSVTVYVPDAAYGCDGFA